MSASVRLQLLTLRRRFNMGLVRLMFLFVGFTLTMYAVTVRLSVEESEEGSLAEFVPQFAAPSNSNFTLVGGRSDPTKWDFRQFPTQEPNLPSGLQEFESRVVAGLGEEGNPVYLSGQEKEDGDASNKVWAFNKVASDKISLWRSLPDMRVSQCRMLQYPKVLPKSSVIIIFNNEALSALLRTVWSVLDRSPENLLEEIILVDDASNKTEITETLPQYIAYRFPPKVKLVRTPHQSGLIRARLAGAEAASGDILIFLDSHCEATKGWLEPMAARIAEDPTVVQIPLIDLIDSNNLHYSGRNGGTDVAVGGFTWSGHFTWESLPEEVRKTRKITEPAKTATMAGGLFAMQRNFFFKLGGYDMGMKGWGGENLELSFRVWRCGGSMENHPCSHVGHIFRSWHPYFIPEDSHGINTARMAEVWMDDFKRFYYLHRSDLKGKDYGDISDRLALVDKLQCKSFRWFLENVYPHKYIMDEQSVAWGRVQTKVNGRKICIDHLQKDQYHKLMSYNLGKYPCHEFLAAAQYFTVSKNGELRNEYMCAEVKKSKSKHYVRMVGCRNGGNHLKSWKINRLGQILETKSGLCLDSGQASMEGELELNECDNVASQTWTFEFYAEGSEMLKPGKP